MSPSSTAVPLVFRRPPVARTGSSQSTPAKTSITPATPTSKREKRPGSKEFTGKADVRPLYLVERHNKPVHTFNPDEEFPALPSSHETSRASSAHGGDSPNRSRDDLDTLPLRETRIRTPLDALDLQAAKNVRPGDVLDSQQTTPTVSTIAAERKRREAALLESALQERMSAELEWQQRQRKNSNLTQDGVSRDLVLTDRDEHAGSPDSMTAVYHKYPSEPDPYYIPPYKPREKDDQNLALGIGAAVVAGGAALLLREHENNKDADLSRASDKAKGATEEETQENHTAIRSVEEQHKSPEMEPGHTVEVFEGISAPPKLSENTDQPHVKQEMVVNPRAVAEPSGLSEALQGDETSTTKYIPGAVPETEPVPQGGKTSKKSRKKGKKKERIDADIAETPIVQENPDEQLILPSIERDFDAAGVPLPVDLSEDLNELAVNEEAHDISADVDIVPEEREVTPSDEFHDAVAEQDPMFASASELIKEDDLSDAETAVPPFGYEDSKDADTWSLADSSRSLKKKKKSRKSKQAADAAETVIGLAGGAAVLNALTESEKPEPSDIISRNVAIDMPEDVPRDFPDKNNKDLTANDDVGQSELVDESSKAQTEDVQLSTVLDEVSTKEKSKKAGKKGKKKKSKQAEIQESDMAPEPSAQSGVQSEFPNDAEVTAKPEEVEDSERSAINQSETAELTEIVPTQRDLANLEETSSQQHQVIDNMESVQATEEQETLTERPQQRFQEEDDGFPKIPTEVIAARSGLQDSSGSQAIQYATAPQFGYAQLNQADFRYKKPNNSENSTAVKAVAVDDSGASAFTPASSSAAVETSDIASADTPAHVEELEPPAEVTVPTGIKDEEIETADAIPEEEGPLKEADETKLFDEQKSTFEPEDVKTSIEGVDRTDSAATTKKSKKDKKKKKTKSQPMPSFDEPVPEFEPGTGSKDSVEESQDADQTTARNEPELSVVHDQASSDKMEEVVDSKTISNESGEIEASQAPSDPSVADNVPALSVTAAAAEDGVADLPGQAKDSTQPRRMKVAKRVSWPAEHELVSEHEISAPPSGIATPAELVKQIPQAVKDLPSDMTSDSLESPSWDVSPPETRDTESEWGFGKKKKNKKSKNKPSPLAEETVSGEPVVETEADKDNTSALLENTENSGANEDDWGFQATKKKGKKGKKSKKAETESTGEQSIDQPASLDQANQLDENSSAVNLDIPSETSLSEIPSTTENPFSSQFGEAAFAAGASALAAAAVNEVLQGSEQSTDKEIGEDTPNTPDTVTAAELSTTREILEPQQDDKIDIAENPTSDITAQAEPDPETESLAPKVKKNGKGKKKNKKVLQSQELESDPQVDSDSKAYQVSAPDPVSEPVVVSADKAIFNAESSAIEKSAHLEEPEESPKTAEVVETTQPEASVKAQSIEPIEAAELVEASEIVSNEPQEDESTSAAASTSKKSKKKRKGKKGRSSEQETEIETQVEEPSGASIPDVETTPDQVQTDVVAPEEIHVAEETPAFVGQRKLNTSEDAILQEASQNELPQDAEDEFFDFEQDRPTEETPKEPVDETTKEQSQLEEKQIDDSEQIPPQVNEEISDDTTKPGEDSQEIAQTATESSKEESALESELNPQLEADTYKPDETVPNTSSLDSSEAAVPEGPWGAFKLSRKSKGKKGKRISYDPFTGEPIKEPEENAEARDNEARPSEDKIGPLEEAAAITASAVPALTQELLSKDAKDTDQAIAETDTVEPTRSLPTELNQPADAVKSASLEKGTDEEPSFYQSGSLGKPIEIEEGNESVPGQEVDLQDRQDKQGNQLETGAAESQSADITAETLPSTEGLPADTVQDRLSEAEANHKDEIEAEKSNDTADKELPTETLEASSAERNIVDEASQVNTAATGLTQEIAAVVTPAIVTDTSETSKKSKKDKKKKSKKSVSVAEEPSTTKPKAEESTFEQVISEPIVPDALTAEQATDVATEDSVTTIPETLQEGIVDTELATEPPLEQIEIPENPKKAKKKKKDKKAQSSVPDGPSVVSDVSVEEKEAGENSTEQAEVVPDEPKESITTDLLTEEPVQIDTLQEETPQVEANVWADNTGEQLSNETKKDKKKKKKSKKSQSSVSEDTPAINKDQDDNIAEPSGPAKPVKLTESTEATELTEPSEPILEPAQLAEPIPDPIEPIVEPFAESVVEPVIETVKPIEPTEPVLEPIEHDEPHQSPEVATVGHPSDSVLTKQTHDVSSNDKDEDQTNQKEETDLAAETEEASQEEPQSSKTKKKNKNKKKGQASFLDESAAADIAALPDAAVPDTEAIVNEASVTSEPVNAPAEASEVAGGSEETELLNKSTLEEPSQDALLDAMVDTKGMSSNEPKKGKTKKKKNKKSQSTTSEDNPMNQVSVQEDVDPGIQSSSLEEPAESVIDGISPDIIGQVSDSQILQQVPLMSDVPASFETDLGDEGSDEGKGKRKEQAPEQSQPLTQDETLTETIARVVDGNDAETQESNEKKRIGEIETFLVDPPVNTKENQKDGIIQTEEVSQNEVPEKPKKRKGKKKGKESASTNLDELAAAEIPNQALETEETTEELAAEPEKPLTEVPETPNQALEAEKAIETLDTEAKETFALAQESPLKPENRDMVSAEDAPLNDSNRSAVEDNSMPAATPDEQSQGPLDTPKPKSKQKKKNRKSQLTSSDETAVDDSAEQTSIEEKSSGFSEPVIDTAVAATLQTAVADVGDKDVTATENTLDTGIAPPPVDQSINDVPAGGEDQVAVTEPKQKGKKKKKSKKSQSVSWDDNIIESPVEATSEPNVRDAKDNELAETKVDEAKVESAEAPTIDVQDQDIIMTDGTSTPAVGVEDGQSDTPKQEGEEISQAENPRAVGWDEVPAEPKTDVIREQIAESVKSDETTEIRANEPSLDLGNTSTINTTAHESTKDLQAAETDSSPANLPQEEPPSELKQKSEKKKKGKKSQPSDQEEDLSNASAQAKNEVAPETAEEGDAVNAEVIGNLPGSTDVGTVEANSQEEVKDKPALQEPVTPTNETQEDWLNESRPKGKKKKKNKNSQLEVPDDASLQHSLEIREDHVIDKSDDQALVEQVENIPLEVAAASAAAAVVLGPGAEDKEADTEQSIIPVAESLDSTWYEPKPKGKKRKKNKKSISIAEDENIIEAPVQPIQEPTQVPAENITQEMAREPIQETLDESSDRKREVEPAELLNVSAPVTTDSSQRLAVDADDEIIQTVDGAASPTMELPHHPLETSREESNELRIPIEDQNVTGPHTQVSLSDSVKLEEPAQELAQESAQGPVHEPEQEPVQVSIQKQVQEPAREFPLGSEQEAEYPKPIEDDTSATQEGSQIQDGKLKDYNLPTIEDIANSPATESRDDLLELPKPKGKKKKKDKKAAETVGNDDDLAEPFTESVEDPALKIEEVTGLSIATGSSKTPENLEMSTLQTDQDVSIDKDAIAEATAESQDNFWDMPKPKEKKKKGKKGQPSSKDETLDDATAQQTSTSGLDALTEPEPNPASVQTADRMDLSAVQKVKANPDNEESLAPAPMLDEVSGDVPKQPKSKKKKGSKTSRAVTQDSPTTEDTSAEASVDRKTSDDAEMTGVETIEEAESIVADKPAQGMEVDNLLDPVLEVQDYVREEQPTLATEHLQESDNQAVPQDQLVRAEGPENILNPDEMIPSALTKDVSDTILKDSQALAVDEPVERSLVETQASADVEDDSPKVTSVAKGKKKKKNAKKSREITEPDNEAEALMPDDSMAKALTATPDEAKAEEGLAVDDQLLSQDPEVNISEEPRTKKGKGKKGKKPQPLPLEEPTMTDIDKLPAQTTEKSGDILIHQPQAVSPKDREDITMAEDMTSILKEPDEDISRTAQTKSPILNDVPTEDSNLAPELRMAEQESLDQMEVEGNIPKPEQAAEEFEEQSGQSRSEIGDGLNQLSGSNGKEEVQSSGSSRLNDVGGLAADATNVGTAGGAPTASASSGLEIEEPDQEDKSSTLAHVTLQAEPLSTTQEDPIETSKEQDDLAETSKKSKKKKKKSKKISSDVDQVEPVPVTPVGEREIIETAIVERPRAEEPFEETAIQEVPAVAPEAVILLEEDEEPRPAEAMPEDDETQATPKRKLSKKERKKQQQKEDAAKAVKLAEAEALPSQIEEKEVIAELQDVVGTGTPQPEPAGTKDSLISLAAESLEDTKVPGEDIEPRQPADEATNLNVDCEEEVHLFEQESTTKKKSKGKKGKKTFREQDKPEEDFIELSGDFDASQLPNPAQDDFVSTGMTSESNDKHKHDDFDDAATIAAAALGSVALAGLTGSHGKQEEESEMKSKSSKKKKKGKRKSETQDLLDNDEQAGIVGQESASTEPISEADGNDTMPVTETPLFEEPRDMHMPDATTEPPATIEVGPETAKAIAEDDWRSPEKKSKKKKSGKDRGLGIGEPGAASNDSALTNVPTIARIDSFDNAKNESLSNETDQDVTMPDADNINREESGYDTKTMPPEAFQDDEWSTPALKPIKKAKKKSKKLAGNIEHEGSNSGYAGQDMDEDTEKLRNEPEILQPEELMATEQAPNEKPNFAETQANEYTAVEQASSKPDKRKKNKKAKGLQLVEDDPAEQIQSNMPVEANESSERSGPKTEDLDMVPELRNVSAYENEDRRIETGLLTPADSQWTESGFLDRSQVLLGSYEEIPEEAPGEVPGQVVDELSEEVSERVQQRQQAYGSKKKKKNKKTKAEPLPWEEMEVEPTLHKAAESTRDVAMAEQLSESFDGPSKGKQFSEAASREDESVHLQEPVQESSSLEDPGGLPDWGFGSDRQKDGAEDQPEMREVNLPESHPATLTEAGIATAALAVYGGERAIKEGLHPPSTVRQEEGKRHQEASAAEELPTPAVEIELEPSYEADIYRHGRHQQHVSSADADMEPELPAYPATREQIYTTPKKREDRDPSFIDSTSKERSSAALFSSSPSIRDTPTQPRQRRHRSIEEMSIEQAKSTDRPKSLFGGPFQSDEHETTRGSPATPGYDGRQSLPLMTITEQSPEDRASQKSRRRESDIIRPPKRRSYAHLYEQRPQSPLTEHDRARRLGHISGDDLRSQFEVDARTSGYEERRKTSGRHERPRSIVTSEDINPEYRSFSGASMRSNESISAVIRDVERPPSASPSLRHEKRSVSSDLRREVERQRDREREGKSASPRPVGAKSAKAEEVLAGVGLAGVASAAALGFASSSNYDPATDKGKGRAIEKMTNVYEAWGEVPGSPRSPSRPPSVRKRQSLQILDLETRLESLVSENRSLSEARSRAERQLDNLNQDHNSSLSAQQDAIRTRDTYLQQKDAELEELRNILNGLQGEVAKLTQVNQELTTEKASNINYEQQYRQLQVEHQQTQHLHEERTRELDDVKSKHTHMSQEMEVLVATQVTTAVAAAKAVKDSEIQKLKSELVSAKEQIRALQQQILEARNAVSDDEVLVTRDEDYFDRKCQQLCSHLQQWVLRFSKFSDRQVARSMAQVKDEKVVDRFENVILDGTEADDYLRDRIRRRDVFMAVVVNMVFEYIFSRYLFGMDREQRQKLKSLEKTLSEVGSPAAVNRWRATTLTLLSRREKFRKQREDDTQAVIQEIMDTLSSVLPPPAKVADQLMASLGKVMQLAVDLSIEMRTQRAEFQMLPPLLPEYDTNGDLKSKVLFNANLMNERSGVFESNEEVQDMKAVVRMVLFPLVVKRGSDDGTGDEEVVICPAQVLIAQDDDGRGNRRGGLGDNLDAMRSRMSVAPSVMLPSEGGMF